MSFEVGDKVYVYRGLTEAEYSNVHTTGGAAVTGNCIGKEGVIRNIGATNTYVFIEYHSGMCLWAPVQAVRKVEVVSFKIGDEVCICKVPSNKDEDPQNNWIPEMEDLIDIPGVVNDILLHKGASCLDIKYDYDSYLVPVEVVKKYEEPITSFQPGDRVKVISKPETEEEIEEESWVCHSMDDLVGASGVVKHTFSYVRVRVDFDDDTWLIHPSHLVKYRDVNPEKVKADITRDQTEGDEELLTVSGKATLTYSALGKEVEMEGFADPIEFPFDIEQIKKDTSDIISTGYQVGDRVTIANIPLTHDERIKQSWEPEMDNYIGENGVIVYPESNCNYADVGFKDGKIYSIHRLHLLKCVEPKKGTTKDQIMTICNSLSTFLQEKNKRYGDSALNPLNIFSKESAGNSILVRLDDKLTQIMNSTELRKKDISNILGDLVLLCADRGWNNFDDLLD